MSEEEDRMFWRSWADVGAALVIGLAGSAAIIVALYVAGGWLVHHH